MKKILLSVLVCSFALTNLSTVFGQITEAIISYEVNMESEDEMVQQQLAMMSGSTMKMSFQDKNFRVDMDMGMMKNSTISNGKSDKTLMLLEIMGMKMAVPMSKEDIDNAKDEEESEKEPTIERTNETKTIAGYECTKIIITDEDGLETIMYVTDKIKPANNKNKFSNDKINGFPLYMEIEQNKGGMEMTMTMSAVKVETKIKDKSLFDTKIPEGYDEKTMKEIEALGMGG